jgi:hypothetical protein
MMKKPQRTRAKYAVAIDIPGIALAITDERNPVTITNDVEAVIADLYERKLLTTGKRLIYRDSLGRWDEIIHKDGKWVRWSGIGTTTMFPALRFVCHQAEHEFDCTGDEWEMRVFMNAAYFRAHRFMPGAGQDEMENKDFRGIVEAARTAKVNGASRVLIYAVALSGRFIAIPERKWDELVELWGK